MKSKRYLIIFVACILIYAASVNYQPYPKNTEWFEMRYGISGNLSCLIPTTDISSVDVDLTKQEIRIRDIGFTKLCDFDKGYIDFNITGLKEYPYIYGLDNSLYSVNRTEDSKFRINLNSDLMNEGNYGLSVNFKVPDKFYGLYRISSNSKPWAVNFYYPNYLFGYSCNECFALLEDKIKIVHPDEKIYESENGGLKQFFFEDEDSMIIQFNPKSRIGETLKDIFSVISLSMIGSIITLFLLRKK